MASEFLVDGDLFVEVVDNNDGGGIPLKRLQTLSQAHRDGTFDTTAFPFERSNGYNGIRQLYSQKGPQENIFRSGWGSSLNFEFVFDVTGAAMTPRWLDGKNGNPPTPSRLTRLTDNSVRLETFVPEPHRVDVSTTFTLVPPCYIDWETTIVARSNGFEGDWLGLFWASYIHAPENKTTYFRGHRDKDAPMEWIPSLEERPPDPRVFASETDPLLPTETDPNGRLFHNIRPIRYAEPVFYGRWRNMMLEMMFKHKDNLRFAIQPTGGGLNNPAWDFALVIRDCAVLKPYHFSGRVVFKPFVSPEDAWAEYQRWIEMNP